MASLQAAVFIRTRLQLHLSFSTYKKLAEWLGCYAYILPAERVNPIALGIPLATYLAGNLTEAWHCYWQIEDTCAQEVQKEILQWISDSSSFPIPPIFSCINVLGNTNSIN